MPTTLVLVRHGETDWNREDRFQGHADIPLNEAGREQARDLVLGLGAESFQALYSSPLLRAYETAAILAESLDLEVERADDLMEVDVGSWSGLTRVEVEARFPQGFRRWLDYGHGWDDGETYDELGIRVVSSLQRIAVAHPEATILAVTHGGPIRSALAAAARVGFGEALDPRDRELRRRPARRSGRKTRASRLSASWRTTRTSTRASRSRSLCSEASTRRAF